MRKRALIAFGIEIKKYLINNNQTQEWLITELKEKTGMYVDSSNLYKLMTGQIKSKKLEYAIKNIIYHLE